MTHKFQELRQELFGLYGRQRYEDALDLVRSSLDQHPLERSRMTFWLACLECRAGRPSEALETLSTFIAAGGWLSPLHLKNEADLDPLRDNPDLQRIIEACETRLAAEQARVEPKLLLELPSPVPVEPPALLVALHMMGGTAEESVHHWRPAVDAGLMLAAPQGSKLLGPGAFAWGDGTAVEVKEHLETAAGELSFDRHRLIVAGASQGARMAVLLAVSGSVPASSFIAVVGAPPPEKLEPHLTGAREAGLRGVFITGEHDGARAGIEATYEFLRQAGLPVKLVVVPGLGHEYPPDFADHIREAIEYLELG